ncbi:phosphatase PAP2 family protein [Nitrincola sp.]|uniref:phosphatase PAP2 family protein n=1 Tax=Nitrincola sp. TaxID=1926584 RepID=UPI003A9400FA
MTSISPVFGTQWRPAPLIMMHLAALLLMLSFISPSGFQLWRQVDSSVFFALNGTLSEGDTWAWVWAWANTRYKDMLLALIMLMFITFPGFGFKRPQLQQALIGFLVLMIVLVPLRYFFYEFAKQLDLSGPSPSMTLSPVYLLTELFSDIPAKDGSSRSFPGDHATVLIIWAAYLIMNARCFGSYLAVLLATLMILPRMVGGAHWFSDVAVGGFTVALPILAWAFYSPVLLEFTRWIEKAFLPLFRLIGRLPLFKQLPFFNP